MPSQSSQLPYDIHIKRGFQKRILVEGIFPIHQELIMHVHGISTEDSAVAFQKRESYLRVQCSTVSTHRVEHSTLEKSTAEFSRVQQST